MGIDKEKVDPSRRSQSHDVKEETEIPYGGKASQPPYLFKSGDTLLAMTQKHNVRAVMFQLRRSLLLCVQMTIAQLVYDNERHYLSEEQIHTKVLSCPGITSRLLRKCTVDENLGSHG
jgi:hypothetical protein